MEKEKKIKVTKDGPYIVTGGIPMDKEYVVNGPDNEPERWEKGPEFPLQQTYALCRCGMSKNMPFCDGSHVKAGFDGTEKASHRTYVRQVDKTEGPNLDVTYAPKLCATARFCHRAGDTWNNTEHSDDPKCREIAIQESADCPSGSLVAWDKQGNAIEPKLEQSISITQDPPRKLSGPIWVKGGIPVESAEGYAYEIRNRVTLCRCGMSKNKPFCDGTHCTTGFNDGDERLK